MTENDLATEAMLPVKALLLFHRSLYGRLMSYSYLMPGRLRSQTYRSLTIIGLDQDRGRYHYPGTAITPEWGLSLPCTKLRAMPSPLTLLPLFDSS